MGQKEHGYTMGQKKIRVHYETEMTRRQGTVPLIVH